MKRKLLFANSNTSSNIGNAFFYEGVKYVLKNCLADIEVFSGLFPPVNPYNLKRTVYISNSFDYFSFNQGVDAVVIAGPVLDRHFGKQFGPVLRNAKKNAKKLILLSIGGRQYDAAEIAHCRSVMSQFQPDIFISRDTDTYNAYHDLAKHAYNGICFAFFTNDYYDGYQTPDMTPYIVSCFDFTAEPMLSFLAGEGIDLETLNTLPLIGAHKTRDYFKRLQYLLKRNLPDHINGFRVIRTCHRPHRNKHLIFFKKNIVSAFIPGPYLNLYKNTELTITDRLHAAVATLTFGKPARLVLDSKRTKLLERARCEEVREKFILAPLDYIAEEKTNMVAWLQEAMHNV